MAARAPESAAAHSRTTATHAMGSAVDAGEAPAVAFTGAVLDVTAFGADRRGTEPSDDGINAAIALLNS